MNNIYKTPLLTSWPIPLSIQNLKECFGIKNESSGLDTEKETKKSPLDYFLNLFSTA